jgi:hypothetical protein
LALVDLVAWWIGQERGPCRGGEDVRARLPARQIIVGVLQQGPDLGEGGGWPHKGNHGHLRLEPITEPLEQDVDELTIRHRITKFPELVRHCLDALAVDAERRGPLRGVADLGVEVVDPGVSVVLEELAERRP